MYFLHVMRALHLQILHKFFIISLHYVHYVMKLC